MEILASVTKPEICVIRDIETKPCHKEDQPSDQEFLTNHRMIVSLFSRETEEDKPKAIADLHCMYVNMDSRKDIEACKDTDYAEIINRVERVNMPLDNLIIVHSATVCRKATLEELSKAFEKIHCILCRAASTTFNTGYDPGIYFDYKFMNSKSAKWIDASVREYTDGDMRKETYDDGCYIHKIPWNPNN